MPDELFRSWLFKVETCANQFKFKFCIGNQVYLYQLIGRGTQKNSQTLKSALKIKKMTFMTKIFKTGKEWDQNLNPRIRGSNIGSVSFWFQSFKLWLRSFFRIKTVKIGQKAVVFFLKNWDKIGPWFWDVWIAPWLNFVHNYTQFFFNSRLLQCEKVDQKWTKNEKSALGKCHFLKTLNFSKILRTNFWTIDSAKLDNIWRS